MAGTRSGSGKIVFEHYDKLVQIWGGSASTKPLSFGVDADSFSEGQESSSSKSAILWAAQLRCHHLSSIKFNLIK